MTQGSGDRERIVLPPPVRGTGPLRNKTTITGPGHCHNHPFKAAAHEYEWIATDTDESGRRGQHHDGDLILGVIEGTSPAAGPLRVHYANPADLRELIAAAARLLAWMEAA